jgi:uncharacterized membrane protein
MVPPAEPTYEVILRPHRSLSPVGFWVIMGILAAWSFVGGIVFLLAGAWPVLGFVGLDVALVWWAFKASYGDRRAHEHLRLADGTFTVERVDKHGGAERFAFPSYWLRVRLEDNGDERGTLVITSHGRSLTIAGFLSPRERAILAEELSAALAKARA